MLSIVMCGFVKKDKIQLGCFICIGVADKYEVKEGIWCVHFAGDNDFMTIYCLKAAMQDKA